MNGDSEYMPVWKNRRKVIFGTLGFCASVIAYLTVVGKDTALNETIVQFSFLTAASIIGAYVFGATWQDVTIIKGKKAE